MATHVPQPEPLAVLAAAVAYFLVGWLWYGPLFGKTWARHMGMPIDHKPTPAELGKGMGLGVVGALLTVGVLAWLTEALDGPNEGLADAVTGAGWIWLGFFVPQQLSAVAWEKRSWALAGINLGYALVALAVAAAVYALVP